MKNIICLIAMLGFASGSAYASTFNFGDYADGINSNGSTFSNSLMNSGLGEFGYTSYSATNDGITVTATGSYVDSEGNTQDAYAYMDGKWRNRAGLGVCKVLNSGDQCAPSSDDNITYNEKLTLVFDTTVSLDGLRFVDGEHYTNFDGDFQLRINNDDSLLYTLSLAEFPLFGSTIPFIGNTFEFISLAGRNSGYAEEFYINTLNVSAVPLPAAAWLFGSALLGFAGFKRFKKTNI